MNRYPMIPAQNLPFSVLFPEVNRLLRGALMRYFPILGLRCVKLLLDVCAEKLTRVIVALPERHSNFNAPFLVLEEINEFGEVRIDGLVHHWHNEISMYDDPDIAHVVFPKVFDFVRDQILLKERAPVHISETDIAALSMLLVKNTNVLYTGRNWWSNKRAITHTFERWFVEVS